MSPVLGAQKVVMGRVGEAGSHRRPESHFGVWSVLQTEEAMWVGWGDSQWHSERQCFPKGTVPTCWCCHGPRGTRWQLMVGWVHVRSDSVR